jgi:hypothetical protein
MTWGNGFSGTAGLPAWGGEALWRRLGTALVGGGPSNHDRTGFRVVRDRGSRIVMQRVRMLVLSGLLLPAALRAQVDFLVKLDPTTVQPGQTARVEATLSWQGAADAYSIEEWVGPVSGGIPLAVESDQVQTEVLAGQPHYRRRAVYQLVPEAPGSLTLEPAHVRIKGAGGKPQEFRSQSLVLTVLPGGKPFPYTDVGLGVLALALVAVAVRLTRKTAPSAPPKDRRALAQERAEALESAGRRDHREFFQGCLEALRSGLAEDSGTLAKEKDRDRLLKAMEEVGLPESRRKAAGELMSLCDEARFNPEPPPETVRKRALALLVEALSGA